MGDGKDTRKIRLKESPTQDEDQRSPFRRDRDRLLYSRAFRRLSGVTQVARVGESYFYHDRLSHSLKVAQVARALANILLHEREYVDLEIESHLNPDVVETAALAHDLGHPPFGHAAEEKLNNLVDDSYGGFEGNAQSFRIITNSELLRQNIPGLNLTLASCNAVLKYPWGKDDKTTYTDDEKWGYYPTESDHFERVRNDLGYGIDSGKRSLEADIMDYADDLTYAIHDVVDFYRAGVIPLDQLLANTNERDRVIDYIHDKEDIQKQDINDTFERLQKRMTSSNKLETPFKGTDAEIAELNRFTSNLIQRYLAPFRPSEVKVDEDTLSLDYDDQIELEITVLKSLTFFYVIDDTPLISQQYGQREVIERLYTCLMDAAEAEGTHKSVIPHPYRGRIQGFDDHKEMEHTRIVVDLITSMTERQALSFYQRLEGIAPGSLREGIIR